MEFRKEPRNQVINAKILPELIEQWLKDVRRRTSDKSAQAARYQIKPFLIWFDEYGPSYDNQLSSEALFGLC